MEVKRKYRFSIDRGGTFCDIYCEIDDLESGKTKVVVKKLLSEDPTHYEDAPREAIRRIISSEEGIEIKDAKEIDNRLIQWIRMGTTVATNALLERKGCDVLLVTSKGFKDLLKIGNQSRPDIFALNIIKPSLLYKKVVEIDERVKLSYSNEGAEDKTFGATKGDFGVELIDVETKPNENDVREQLQKAFDEGFRSVAVVLLHSYVFFEHEKMVGRIAQEIGFKNVSLSHEVMPMIRAVPRGLTTLVDAYLSPILRDYVQSFCSGFKNDLEGVDVEFMQSDGGLTPAKTFTGSRAIFSGPAAGVVGFVEESFEKRPLIGFDMGGTSTDVSRYDGHLNHVFDVEVAGCSIQIPQLDITTVAAGGGSRLFFKQGRFIVGPESAGSHPGPICYGKKGGLLAVTDANLLLGRLVPEHFPKIFGETEDQPLDYEKTKKAFVELTKKVNEHRRKFSNSQKDLTIEEVALGFLQVANEQMARPIRAITIAKGYDSRDHELCSFGGAAGQHACSVARLLGMNKIKIHKYCGILSAVGLSIASVVEEEQEHCNFQYVESNFDHIEKRFSVLEEKCKSRFNLEKFKKIDFVRYLNLRYDRTDYSIMTFLKDGEEDYRKVFEDKYKKEYGFQMKNRDVIIDDIRVRAIGVTSKEKKKFEVEEKKQVEVKPIKIDHDLYLSSIGWKKVPLYDFALMQPGTKIQGPCVVLQNTSTITVLPNCEFVVDALGNIEIHVFDEKSENSKIEKTIALEKPDPILLSIFSNRFMSIAEQMGQVLQRTAISTNIKERLDFSCAIFGPDGNLVANAQFIPVHLGSMADAVKYQINVLGDNWKEGEVIMSNHPMAGGAHLPDITLITPVFSKSEKKALFYVASRGHHADIGGITPGSMPPFSKFLSEEGASVKSFKIVENGDFNEEGARKILSESRNIGDNIADLKAQIAANQKGIDLFKELINEYGLKVVQSYMNHIQNNTERAVRDMLIRFSKEHSKEILRGEDRMDDGSTIKLEIRLNKETGDAVFDFTGTTSQVLGNTNVPRAVTNSAVLYCLRCLVNEDIPLNNGCLKPISIIMPSASLLHPSEEAAVVGGNVLTSQRITDTIFKCFGVVAASQGCMNNFTFGNSKFGYYETICGGSGAGENFDGHDSVHTHMTNTRITDPEILEERYPVILREFSVRDGSGGIGKWRGGNGVVRRFEFLENLQVGILSERRVFAPYGLQGGGEGKRGQNILIKRKINQQFNLGSKNAFPVECGDVVVIKTPGGGAFGKL